MPTIAGVFLSYDEATKAAAELRENGMPKLHLLIPGAGASQLDTVPTSETEQPGMGEAVGGVVGGAVGIAAGLQIGSAAATVLIPGVGPILAVGLATAALFGVGGAVGGAAAGSALEDETTKGVPSDDLFVYRDALKKGRSVLFVDAADDDEAVKARAILANHTAESIDAARDEWWIGLRGADQERYPANPQP